MYETHFGLRERPFRTTPDSEWYYPATSHEQALAQLSQAIAEDEGLALLTGAPGTGKTLLCHCLLERFGEDTLSAFLTNSHVPDCIGLLQAIHYDLSLPYEGRSEQELRLGLTDLLLDNYRKGRRAVLVVDEAQHLSPELLEELRLLGNLEGRRGKAFQVVLVAQPGFLATVEAPQLAAFRQRLALRSNLDTLGVHEAADFLIHRIRHAGGRPEEMVSDEALGILARGTHGVPRLLCRAAHQALCLAHAAGATLVDAEAALEGLAALGLNDDESVDEAAEPAVPCDVDAVDESALPAPEETTDKADLGDEDDSRAAEALAQKESGRLRRLFAAPRRSA